MADLPHVPTLGLHVLQETRFGHCKMPATILPPSERGYNILAFPDKGAPVLEAEAPYRLVCVVDGPVECSERSVARMELLHGPLKTCISAPCCLPSWMPC